MPKGTIYNTYDNLHIVSSNHASKFLINQQTRDPGETELGVPENLQPRTVHGSGVEGQRRQLSTTML